MKRTFTLALTLLLCLSLMDVMQAVEMPAGDGSVCDSKTTDLTGTTEPTCTAPDESAEPNAPDESTVPSEQVYFVNVTWGDLTFGYQSTTTWNPETFCYEKSGGWTPVSKTVGVLNASNVPIVATMSAVVKNNEEIPGIGTTAVLMENNPMTLAAVQSDGTPVTGNFTVTLTGQPSAAFNLQTIATLTVTIADTAAK